MRPRMWLPVIALVGIGAVLAGPVAAHAADADVAGVVSSAGKRIRLADQWAGEVEGTDAYISVFTLSNRRAGAYLADGADIATLVLGKRTGSTIDLRPTEGTEVTATVDGATVTGTVTIDGSEYDFTAERSTGDGGWYRGRKTSGGETVAAAFIVLEDGSYRGAIREGDEVIATPDFDPGDLTLDLPEGGTIKVLPVAAFVKKEQKLA
jgi:type II secretory pathway pseudopilin PulG